MTWFRADDQQHSHPKVIEAGLEAMGLWLLAGTYCCDKLTDGFVAWPVIERLAGGKAKARTLAKRLVEAKGESAVGLWEYVDGGCRFHDWAVYQLPAAEERARRAELSAKRSAAGMRGAQKRWQTDGSRDGKPALLPSDGDGKPDGKTDSKRDGKPALLPSDGDGKPIAPSPDPDPNKSPQPPLPAPAEPETWELPGHEADAWARGISDATKKPCSAPDATAKAARAAIHRAVQTHCPPVATAADRARWTRARAREYALAQQQGALLTAFNFEAHLNTPNRPKAANVEPVVERPYHRTAKLYERPPTAISEYELHGAAALAKATTTPNVNDKKGAVSP